LTGRLRDQRFSGILLDGEHAFVWRAYFFENGFELLFGGGRPTADAESLFPVQVGTFEDQAASSGCGKHFASPFLELSLGQLRHGDDEFHGFLLS